MKTYIVTFEIKNKSTLDVLKEELRKFDNYCPIHDNAWAIQTESKAANIRNKLTSLINTKDRLFVIRSGVESAWLNSYGEKNDDWLKKYL